MDQPLEDAWWTGPVLASSAATAPQGHFMVEPSFYDSIVVGQFDEHGAHQNAPKTHSTRAAAFVLYGLSDRLSVGIIPTYGFNRAGDGSLSSTGLGDFSFQTQYRLTDFQEGRPVPTTSVLLTATIPTGKYDRLGSHPEDGLGSGAYVLTASLYSQYYLWLPTRRILRTRFDFSFSMSDHPNVHDVSVYGTPQGFRGKAAPGDSFVACLAGEYSITRNWVAALEVAYQHADETLVTGVKFATPGRGAEAVGYRARLGSSSSTALAPEIEYNWSERAGIIAGAIFTVSGRNVAETLTPVLAVNYNL